MSPAAHERRCLDVLHAVTVDDFRERIVAASRQLGFESVAAVVVTQHSPSLTEFQAVSNAPLFLAESAHGIGPVLQFARRCIPPFPRHPRGHLHPESETLWLRQPDGDANSGLVVAMHLARGRHFVMGAMGRPDRDPMYCSESLEDDFLRLAEHAQAAAFELTLPSRRAPASTRSLARRELEALGCTMDGMNSREVGDRMSISERHATLLLHRAMQKLGCSTKYECALLAIRLGLITCR